eukprot:m.228094 g.228094  ORF g.228094 m.228094 type:complete len:427 (-) comp33537_c0_seq1:193-1473(-)
MSVMNTIAVLGCCLLTTSSGLSVVNVKHDHDSSETTALFDTLSTNQVDVSARFESEWIPIKPFTRAKAGFGISKMNDGGVFAALGLQKPGVEWLTSEIFNDGAWKDLPNYIDRSLTRAMFGQYTNSSANGDIYAVGGISFDNTRRTDTIKYDFTSARWQATSVPLLGSPRSAHGLAVLPNGSVVIIGGQMVSTSTLDTGEIWDAGDLSWRPITPMDRQRAHFCTGVLQDGKVIVVGGNNSDSTLSSVQLWDPEQNSWEALPDLQQARAGCGLTVLNNGSVVIAGGSDGVTTFESAEIYHPATKQMEPFHPMGTARVSFGLITLNNGSIIAMGGYDSRSLALYSCEMWTPPTPSPSPPPSPPPPPGNLYRCIADACVVDTNGVDLKECESFCGLTEYRCENNRCVLDVRGMNQSICNTICGPPSHHP